MKIGDKVALLVCGILFLICIAIFMSGYNIGKASVKSVNPRSYQIQCTPDSIYIYDGEKRIGVIDYDDNSNFSNLILNDNL